MLSEKFRRTLKLSNKKYYQIAHESGIHPSTLSRIACGIEKVKLGDRRVISIGQVLGLLPQECFEVEDME